ncbi:hypothetical protein LTR36_001235 [Oleoguttula mirabilis]|uniref:Uncharacterized protein n=1 Tax=Oleoguttula mirabilis TaxID=1507867 RepID=A0AAV9JNP0_9PEZI|nr:hypothetical protein LTR36_001235 [Oleoguttula mirabilis]
MSPPTLLGLPPELRCMMYDHLFTDVFKGAGIDDTDTYRLPSEWPSCHYSTYASLVNTCKQVHAEAVPYFEAHHLADGITVYTDSVPHLHALYTATAALKAAYQHNINFSLRDTCVLLCRDYLQENAEHFAIVPKFAPEMDAWILGHANQVQHDFATSAALDTEGWHECSACRTKLHVVRRCAPAGASVRHCTKQAVSVVAREINNDPCTLYVGVMGRVRDL